MKHNMNYKPDGPYYMWESSNTCDNSKYYIGNLEWGTCGCTTDLKKADGLYCHRCGTKTYLAADGSHRRCPKCDDQSSEWIITCESK